MGMALARPVNEVPGNENGSLDSKGVAPTNTNCLTQGGSGPAGLAALIILQVMAMYNKIVDLQQQQTKNMAAAQVSEATAEANSTKAAGKAALTSAWASAALTFASAVVAVGVSVGCNRFGAAGKANTKMQGLDEHMETMNKFDELQKGKNPTPRNNAGSGAQQPLTADMQKIKDGDYTINGTRTGDAIEEFKRRGTWDQVHADFLNEKSMNRATYNAQGSIMQNAGLVSNQAVTVVNGFGQSGSKVADGLGQNAQQNHNANATYARTASQMAGTAGGTNSNAAEKASQSAAAQMQVYQALVQSGNPR